MQQLHKYFGDYFQGGIIQFARKLFLRVRFRVFGPFLDAIGTYQRFVKFRGNAVVVYSMGKVGSSSIFYTLMRALPFSSVYHNHFLSDHWLRTRLPGSPFTRNITLAKTTLAGIKKKRMVYFIVPVRDPVARDVSNLFQNARNERIDLRSGVDDLIGNLHNDGHQFFVEWFDTEFKNFSGIDVRGITFDRNKGFSVHQNDTSAYLFVALETVGDKLMGIISDFIGFNVGREFRFNETESKSDSLKFKKIKSAYYLTSELEQAAYNNEVIRAFYSEQQLLRFKKRWEN